MNATFMRLLIATLAAFVSGSASAQFFFFDPSPPVVYVGNNPRYPQPYDPFYNRPKGYYPPPVLYETKEKSRHGKKVTTKTTVKNQYGQVVYQNKKTKTVKKKK